ncbi:MAG: cysteine hydrolase [Spirochaetes bacterium]|nr:cysteine hydrolase [Spirochaetota bacterium]
MKTALMVVDVQNDYFPKGKMELYGSSEAACQIGKLLTEFRNRSMPVVHIQHIAAGPNASFFLPGTPGADFYEMTKPSAGEKVFIKHYPNSFRETGLDDYLVSKGIRQLLITGMMTHMCIDTTVRAAYDLGYICITAGDCCATRPLKINNIEISAENVHNSFLASLNGTFSEVLNSADAVKLINSRF